MEREGLMYANVVQDALQTAQFSPEELNRLSAIKNKWNVNGMHDAEEFRLECADLLDETSFRNHIVTYLQEYRLQVQETEIEQFYIDGYVRDFRGNPMSAMGKRSIKDKALRNEGLSKVTADLLCMQELDRLCAKACDGETIIYASTPDLEVGYTYGFLYIGHISELNQANKKITLTSIRLDNAKFDDYNSILSDLTHKHISFSTPNECLVNPELIRENLTKPRIFNTLKKYCNFEYNPAEKKKYDDIINQMASRITDYIRFVKSGASLEERIAGFQTLEKYAIELKENYGKVENYQIRRESNNVVQEERDRDFRGFIHQYKDKELSQAVGSCSGIKTGRKSANMYGVDSIFNSDYSIHDEVDALLEELGFGEEEEDGKGSLKFRCKEKPKGCGKWIKRPRGKLLKNCYLCGVDLSCGISINISRSDPTKMTVFRNEGNNYIKAKGEIINRAELHKGPDNKTVFSITIFQGSSTQLTEEGENISRG